MGHYWSEVRIPPQPRNQTALEAMNFTQYYGIEFDYRTNKFYVHEPCMQVFYVHYYGKLHDAIWKHGRECL